jgi:G3E family GTPase
MGEGGAAFTVLTGFLGAGKTTVVNRVLASPGGRRVAVLVNELGRVAIDGKLILSRGGDVLELAGGCLCCKIDVKNDLWDGIADVIRRSSPDHVLLETTGIAEPPAIIDGLTRLPADVAALIEPAGVVCVVDGEAALDTLARRDEARVQIEHSERLILSKLDRISGDQLAALHRGLDGVAGDAERASFPAGNDGDRALADYVLARRAPRRRHGHHHDHAHGQGQLIAVSFVDDAPLVAAPLLALIESLRAELLRVKGFVHLVGDDRRGILELAGHGLELRPGEPWGAAPRRTELVLIGEALDEAALRRQLWACRASS